MVESPSTGAKKKKRKLAKKSRLQAKIYIFTSSTGDVLSRLTNNLIANFRQQETLWFIKDGP